MAHVKNIATGEIIEVNNTKSENGLVVGRYEFGTRFYNKYGHLFKGHEVVDGRTILTLADGYEIIDSKTAKAVAKAQQQEPQAEPQPQTFIPSVEEIKDEPAQMAQQPVQQPYTKAETSSASDIFGGLFQIVEQRVTENVRAMIQPQLAKAILKVQIVDTKGIVRTMQGTIHEEFGRVCQLVSDGVPVYLYGPAGSGKNILASQVAEGLGMPYYYQSCVKDDFVLTGTPTATGEYCPSEFYNAFTKGGIYVLDEADSIPQDVSLVLNQAIANGEFTFPVVGTVKAHENFRIIACGNTAMAGASAEYNGRYAQDGAFKNRFAFVNIGYDPRIEESLAGGDAEIVDFIRQLRHSAEERHIILVCGYRQIKGMARYKGIFKPEQVIDMFVTQGMRVDELRILSDGLDTTENKYCKAFLKMAKAA